MSVLLGHVPLIVHCKCTKTTEAQEARLPHPMGLAHSQLHKRLSRSDISGSNSGAGGAEWRSYRASHPAIVKRRVRKGIPDCLRGLAWQLLSGGRDLLLENDGIYSCRSHFTVFNKPFELASPPFPCSYSTTKNVSKIL